jgi:hypothetical protein
MKVFAGTVFFYFTVLQYPLNVAMVSVLNAYFNIIFTKKIIKMTNSIHLDTNSCDDENNNPIKNSLC